MTKLNRTRYAVERSELERRCLSGWMVTAFALPYAGGQVSRRPGGKQGGSGAQSL